MRRRNSVPLGLLNVSGDEIVVVPEEAHPDESEEDVQLLAKTHGLLCGLPERLDGLLLVADSAVEVGPREEPLSHLALAQILFGISDRVVQFLHLLLNLGLHSLNQRGVDLPFELFAQRLVEWQHV